MSTEETVTVVLFGSAVLIVYVAMMPVIIGPSPRKRQRRHDEQLAELRGIEPPRGQPFELDWMRFRDLSKQEIADVLALSGFHPTGERITTDAWLLSFAEHSSADVQPPP